jgi:cell division protease FtsH
MGPLAYGEDEGEVFLGRSVTQHKGMSDLTAKQIDEDIRTVINRNYQRAEKLLDENIDKLHAMSKLLIKYETIDSDQIDAIMDGREPGEPKGWSDKSDNTPPSASDASSEEEAASKPADQLH